MMERESIYFPVPFDFMNSVPRGVNGGGWVRFYLSPPTSVLRVVVARYGSVVVVEGSKAIEWFERKERRSI